MKKISCILLALLFMLGLLAGCEKKGVELPSRLEGESSGSTPAPVQAKGPYSIGLVQYMEYGPLDEAREAFMSRLDEWGFDDSKVSIDYQNAGGSAEKAEEICSRFVQNQVDVIVAISSPAAKAAAKASQSGSTQVVFLAVGDPQGDLGASAGQSGSNITGVADLVAARAALDLAMQVDPYIETVGLLFDPACPFGNSYVQAMRDYCAELEISLVEGQVASAQEAKDRMTELCGQVDAVFSPLDSTLASVAKETAQAALDAKKPWYVCSEDIVKQGAFAAIGVDQVEAGNKAADMAVQLVSGREISALPVYAFEKGRVSLNQTAMTFLSLDVPEEVLGSANFYDTVQEAVPAE